MDGITYVWRNGSRLLLRKWFQYSAFRTESLPAKLRIVAGGPATPQLPSEGGFSEHRNRSASGGKDI